MTVDALAIVEKYEALVHYLYPIIQRSPKHHGVNLIRNLNIDLAPLHPSAKGT